MVDLNEFQDRVHKLAVDNGFWEEERNAGEMIALIHSELSEMLEALRSDEDPMSAKIPQFTLEEEEAADVLIRLLDYCAGRGLNLEGAAIAKHDYNKGRTYKHGKNF